MSNLSAFAALQDEDQINYEANSDDSIESDDEIVMQTPLQTISQPIQIQVRKNIQPQAVINQSAFSPNGDNLIFKDDYIIIGLKKNEFILCHGQYNLYIQRGALMINNNLFNAGPTPIPFIQSLSHSIPLLQSTQVTDRSNLVDERNPDNEHLFTPDYKTIIKIETLNYGLGEIGILYPPLKNLFHNNLSSKSDDESQYDHFQKKFKSYTFEVILQPSNVNGLHMDKSWSQAIQKLASSTIVDDPPIILIIGNKNTGKSTLSNLLLNSYVHQNPEIGISYLDLDPGQPEFSLPDSISLSYHTNYVHGLPATPPSYIKNHFIGFNSPNIEPGRYDSLVEDLVTDYNSNFRKLLSPLIINFPGWIKGFGLNLISKLTNLIKPTNLIYLTNNTLEDFQELSMLNYETCQNLQSYKVISKYSSNQLRIFKKILYFHKTAAKYNFTNILLESPYQISYTDAFNLDFNGICGSIILNSQIDHSDMSLVLDSSIVALYGIDINNFNSLQNEISYLTNQPPLIKSELMDEANVKFYGLCLIHSVNTEKKEVNLYTPIQMNTLMEDRGSYKLVFVKGLTDYPLNEFLINDFAKMKELPYLNFDNNKINKTSTIRRNITRRNQSN